MWQKILRYQDLEKNLKLEMQDKCILWKSIVSDNWIHFPHKNPFRDNELLTSVLQKKPPMRTLETSQSINKYLLQDTHKLQLHDITSSGLCNMHICTFSITAAPLFTVQYLIKEHYFSQEACFSFALWQKMGTVTTQELPLQIITGNQIIVYYRRKNI
jgi:hypothetical protein